MARRTGSWLPAAVVATLLLSACGDAAEVAAPGPAPSPPPQPPTAEPAPGEKGGIGSGAPDGSDDVGAPSPGPEPAPSPRSVAPAEPEVPEGPAGRQDPLGSGDEVDTAEESRDVSAPPPAGEPAAIVIEHPAAGGRLEPGPLTASGEATVYEGTLHLSLIAPDGSVVEEAVTTAAAGAPEGGPWSHTFDAGAEVAGVWTLVAVATDPSDGEGHPPARTSVTFDVAGPA